MKATTFVETTLVSILHGEYEANRNNKDWPVPYLERERMGVLYNEYVRMCEELDTAGITLSWNRSWPDLKTVLRKECVYHSKSYFVHISVFQDFFPKVVDLFLDWLNRGDLRGMYDPVIYTQHPRMKEPIKLGRGSPAWLRFFDLTAVEGQRFFLIFRHNLVEIEKSARNNYIVRNRDVALQTAPTFEEAFAVASAALQ